ncbi:hypothetical protein [Kangiella shandongensis]|uniref:hypothetical protein n=1 Tax=Kangiella shandongensis TaxID=2763258 RepID=UPI001CC18F0C|nr:hypothetical protein [Kangiella shandongensis]
MFQSKSMKTVVASAIAILVVSGCELTGEGKFTGGGHMNSAGGDKNAVFTFNVKKCDGMDATGKVNYQDQSAIDFEDIGGVKLKAEVTDFGLCTMDLSNPDLAFECSCLDQYEAQFTYESSNPGAPGSGTGYACFVDTGEGKGNFHGAITAFSLSDGPFDGYLNHGTLNGNVQDHGCPSSDEETE